MLSEELEGWGLLYEYWQTQLAIRTRVLLEEDRYGSLITVFKVFTMFPYGTVIDDDSESKDFHG